MAKGILNVGGYTILKRLGNGARSTIYSAVDDQEDRIVALKRVILEKPEDVRVFEQTEIEFKVANKIDHPYVRKCFKLRKVRHLFKVKELLMSMELFEGKTLEEASTLSLGDYKLPTIRDIPELVTVLLEPGGGPAPFDSKGIGESSNTPVAAAIANAVSDAIGAPLLELPITAERVLQALKNKR